MWTLGSSPKESSQPQNIFVRVASWTWISSPITGFAAPPSQPPTPAPARRSKPIALLERVGGLEQLRLGEGRRGDLQADRQLGPPPVGLGARPAGIEIAGIPASDIGTVK